MPSIVNKSGKQGKTGGWDWSALEQEVQSARKKNQNQGGSAKSGASTKSADLPAVQKGVQRTGAVEYDWSGFPTNEMEELRYYQDKQERIRRNQDPERALQEYRIKEMNRAYEQAERQLDANARTSKRSQVMLQGFHTDKVKQADSEAEMAWNQYERDAESLRRMGMNAGSESQYADYLDRAAAAGMHVQEKVDQYNEAAKKDNPGLYYAQTMSLEDLEAKTEELRKKRDTAQQVLDTTPWSDGMGGTANSKALSVDKRIKELNDELDIYQAALAQRRLWDNTAKYQEYVAAFTQDGQLTPEAKKLAEQGRAAYERDNVPGASTHVNSSGAVFAGHGGKIDAPPVSWKDRAVTEIKENGLESLRHYAKTYEERNVNDGYLSDDQKELYYAIYARDPKIAREYLTLAQEQADNAHYQGISDLAGKNLLTQWFGMQGAAIGNLLSGLDPYGEFGQGMSKTSEAITRGGAQAWNEFSGTIGENVPVLGGKGLGDLYGLGVSMIESGIVAAAAYAAGDYNAAAGKVVEFLGTALMGSSAAASDYRECMEAGLSKQQAMIHATAAGIAEAAFEYISLDKLISQASKLGLDATWKEHIKEAIKNVFVQGGVEASEEFSTTVANRITDGILAQAGGYDTKIQRREQELVAMGMDRRDARKKAEQEWLADLINDGIGGFLSGGIMSGTASFTELSDVRQEIKARDALRRLGDTDGDLVTAETEAPWPEWDDGSREAENETPLIRQPNGLTTSPQGEGLNAQTQGIYEQTRQQFAEQTRKLDDATLQAMADNVEQNLEETRATAPPSEVAVMEAQRDALRREISRREAVNRNGERMERAAQAAEVPGPEWNDGSREAGNETPLIRHGGAVTPSPQGEGLGGQLDRAAGTEERIAAAPAAPRNDNIEGGLNYGRGTESAADRGQRDAGLGAGGQTGSLGEGAGGPVARGGRGRKIVELLAHVKAVGAEKTSSARLEGLQGGTNNASIYLLSEDMLTDSLREQVEKKAEEGIELRFTLNPIEVRDELGQVHGVNGVQITTADGRQIEYVQANSRKYSPEQIVAHEDFHAMLARNPALKRQLIDWLYSNHTEKEISSMVAAYARATRGIYDGKENAVELYFEDMLADFASQMERGDKDAAMARETAGKAFDEFSGEIENARQNRAGIDRTNGPGQMYSINNTRKKTIKEQMKDYRAGRMKAYDEFFFGNPPEIYESAGFGNDPFVMAQSDFEKSKTEKHNVPNRVWNNIQGILADPILSFEAGNRFGILTKEIDGDGKPLLIAVEKDSLSDNEKVNRIKSAYGLDNPNEWTKNQITEGKQLRIYDIEKAIEYLKDKGYKAELTDNYRSGDIVADVQEIVKSENDGVDWIGNQEKEQRFSATDEEDVGSIDLSQYTGKDYAYMEAVKNGDEDQIRWMNDEAARQAGFSHKGFHQTGADFTSFNTDNEVAGQFDDETPTGIFIKPTDEDIGLTSGTKQMPLYFKADNMLEFANREEIRDYWKKNVPGYRELDAQLQARENELKRQYDELDAEWFRVYEETYGSDDQSKLDDLDRQQDEFLEKWNKELQPIRRQMKNLVTEYMKGSDYDGIHLKYDGKVYGGPKVETYIVFDPKQTKSAELVTRDNQGKVIPISERFRTDRTGTEEWKNRDLRFSAADEEDVGGVDWLDGSELETTPRGVGSARWSELRGRVSEMNERQRRSLVSEAAELNNATWREEGLGIKPYSGDLADTEAVLRYVDDAVAAVKSEPGSAEYDPSFDLEALPRNEGSDLRFSAADEEDNGVDGLDGSELEETAGPSRTPAPTEAGERIATGPEGPRNDKAGSAARTDVPSSVTAQAVTPSPQGEGFAALAREKKIELAERTGIDGLKSRIKAEEKRMEAIRTAERMGLVAQDAKSRNELAARKADVQETIDIFRGELEKKQAAKKAAASDKALKAERKQQRAAEKKALAKEAELKDNKPRQARREFREDALNLFSVQAGKRQTLGNIINSFADKLIAQGSVSEADRAELFRQLYEAGVEVVQADEYHRNIRETVDSARIYVPDSVRAEFGDDWNDFRQKAWGNGVYLTNSQNDRGADSWNAKLAEMFPGSFDAGETDARTMLENIVDLAEEGKAEFVSLPEMMRRNQAETGVTVDQQMDELERKVDQMIDTFAQKADLEIRTRKQGTMQLVKERQRNREMAARQAQRQRDNNTRNEVMKQLQQLNRMRKKSAPEIQKQIDDIIGNLDTMARSISPEGMENLQALARKYSEAAQDPNFLGNPYVEARLARLSQTQLDSLEVSDVIELGRTISALVKTVTEDKRLLTVAREKEIDQAAREVNREIASSAGSKGGKLREFLGNEHLSPTRELQRLGGWVRGGMMEQLSRSLEDGGTRRMEYQRQATRIFDKFLEDKANQKWLQKAQGEDADWIKVTVPAGITAEDGTAKIQNVTFELTPMMRVGLLMHSRNVDNLRHIETGGIVIPNKKFYQKGDMANADAKGTRVKLRPEVVRAIVKDCTSQEKAFASLLEQYYDGFSKEKINEVSMLIDGFERAGGNHYYGIKVSRKFLAALPEQIQKNMSLESIGSIVNERIHAGNPIILEDASTALKDHIDLISKYYGYTAPIRDFNAVMNYTFHNGMGEGGAVNAYAGSVKETLQDKWGAGAQKYVDELLADLQQSSNLNDTTSRILSALRGNLAGASLMFNPAVAISQTASLPGAIQVVGFDGMVAGLKPEKVDMNLVEKYTPILWYRNQGNSTQELGDYMSRQGLEGKLPWMFNWIQKMDSWTIRRLWAASEYRVSKDTDLAPGSKAQIDAGEDAYYQEVARVFQRAVYDTQPNYSEMQRPEILRSKKDLTKFLTMYKTVPLQYYNMMYEAVGRLKADKARFEADGSAANKAQFEQSRSFAVRTFAGVLGANVVYVVMKAAVKGLLAGKDDRFKDEEGKFDWGKTFGGLGKDLVETYAGSVIFGSELLSGLEKLYSAATTGKYSMYGGLEISALGAVEDTLGGFYNLAKELNKQDLTGGLGAIKELAKQLAMDTGIPANNIETYLLGTAKWFAPEWVDRYENFFDEFERADLKGEHGRDLRAAISVLMDNRTDGLKDETIDELMRLWETGQNAVIPSAIPSKVSVEGEDVEIKGAGKAAFRERWGQVINNSLEKLLASDAYQAADDAGKAKLISKLYEYARQQAAAAVTDKKVDAWVEFGKACEAAGIPLDQYLSVASVDKSKLKDMDGEALDNAIQARMEFRVGELDEKTLDELGRLYAAGGTSAIPADVPTSVSVSGEENNLTAEERVAWLQAWKRTAGENLEALMASKAYAKADDADKAKLISALYDMARASASSEVVAGYEPDKWISVGMEAAEKGVPIDEYAAFHVALSGLKSAEKMSLLKSQKWTESQKEFLWKKLMASDSQLAKYENLKKAGVMWSTAMERLEIGEPTTSSSGLTDAQQVQYDKYWTEISQPATQRLMNNTAYKSADKATQAAYLDRLNDYAARVAKAKVLEGYDKGKWVECGERLTAAGVKLDDYVVYYEGTSDAKNRDKYDALVKTGWTDSQKLIALEYISSSTYSAAKVCTDYQINLDLYLNGLAKADADQSGNISQAEAEDYIDRLSIGREEKAYLWQMLSIQSKWKNNPYSAGYGEEIWHDLHPEG